MNLRSLKLPSPRTLRDILNRMNYLKRSITPPKEKLVHFGVLVLTTGLLTLVFGSKECSDFWGDCMRTWWQHARSSYRGIRRLVVYLDNGPKNSGGDAQVLTPHD